MFATYQTQSKLPAPQRTVVEILNKESNGTCKCRVNGQIVFLNEKDLLLTS